MKKYTSIVAATALAVTALAAPAAAGSGQACETGWFSDAWLCADVLVPDSVTLAKSGRVEMDITVDYSASDYFELDLGNWITVTSEATGLIWVFDLTPVSSTREEITLTLDSVLAPGRYTIDLQASGEVYYGYGAYDYEWFYLSQDAVASFTVKAPGSTSPSKPKAKAKATKTTMKLSASRKTVAYNKKVTLKGSVLDTARTPVKNKKLTVYFDPEGEKPKKKVGTVKTNAKGAFSKAFRQKVPGRWTVEWKGSSSFKKSSKSVSTKVKAKSYKNCKAVNKDYPGGVARTAKAAWKSWENHEPVVFKALYNKNKKLDRDKDGVACER